MTSGPYWRQGPKTVYLKENTPCNKVLLLGLGEGEGRAQWAPEPNNP